MDATCLESTHGTIFHIERDLCADPEGVKRLNGTKRLFKIYLVRLETPDGMAVPGSQAVLKVPNLTQKRTEFEVLRSIEREATVLARLREPAHPQLVTLLEQGTLAGAPEVPYLLLNYVAGENVRDLLATMASNFSLYQTLALVYQLTTGLTHLHSREIFHCDFKPSNIMLDYRSNHAVLIDFGSAWTPEQHPHENLARGKTWEYAAPELFDVGNHARYDETTDLYSLALVMFELLTGEPYFKQREPKFIREGRIEWITAQRNRVANTLRPIVPAGADALATIIEGCTQFSPDERRYRNATELFVALQQVVSTCALAGEEEHP